MASDPTHYGGVFVIDFALNESMAEGAITLGGGNPTPKWVPGWLEPGWEKLKPLKYFSLTELVQRLTGDFFQRLTEQDEANVTVFGVSTGIGGQRDDQRLIHKFIFIFRSLEQLDVSRQAGRMSKEHAECDLAAAGIVTGEAREEIDHWLLKIELATVVQDHAGSGGGEGFSDRSQVVHCDRTYAFGALCVSEMPETFVRDELAAVSYPHGCTGKCALGNAEAQNIKGALKLFVLIAGGVGQRLQIRGIGTLVQKIFLLLLLFSVYNTLSSQDDIPA